MPKPQLCVCGFCLQSLLSACVCVCVRMVVPVHSCFKDPARSNTNSIHQTILKRFQRHTSYETSNGRGGPFCPTTDAVKLILTSWGHVWCAGAISCIGRTRPLGLRKGMENIILGSAPNEGNARQRFKGYSVAELNGQTVSPYDRGYKRTLHPSLSLQCDSQKLTENMDSVRTLRKSSVSCAQMCTFCSLSVCLYLSCSLPHTHIHTVSHTQLDSAKTPMGESVWLLEMSNCFVTSNLSQGA